MVKYELKQDTSDNWFIVALANTRYIEFENQMKVDLVKWDPQKSF